MQTGIFKRAFLSGAVIGTIALAAFGATYFVHAVPPASITNPQFGPQDADVSLNYRFNCIQFGPAANPVCPAGYTMTGGGGDDNSDDNRVIPVNVPRTYTTRSGIGYIVCCQLAP